MVQTPDNIRTPDQRPKTFGKVQPEQREQTQEAEQGLADETGIEVDNAIERPKDV